MIFSPSRLKSFFLVILPSVCLGVFIAFQFATFSTESVVITTDGPEDAEFWKQVIKQVGGVEAYKLFGEKNDKKTINVVHDLAHSFGEALYKTEGIDGVTVCDSNYAFGCYHSFFGWALIDNGIDIISDLDAACISVYGEKGLGCQHGIGHGVIAELGSDNLSEALDACSTLNWQGPVGGCSSGVFMEYNLSTMGTAAVREYNPELIYYPCTEVADRYTQACYFEQPSWWLQHVNMDYKVVGEFCAGVADTVDREMCYRGTGNVASGMSGFDIPTVIAACDKMTTTEGVTLCTEGAVWVFSGEKDIGDTWQQLCEPLEKAGKESCLANKVFI
jgi:hypothetical protein